MVVYISLRGVVPRYVAMYVSETFNIVFVQGWTTVFTYWLEGVFHKTVGQRPL